MKTLFWILGLAYLVFFSFVVVYCVFTDPMGLLYISMGVIASGVYIRNFLLDKTCKTWYDEGIEG